MEYWIYLILAGIAEVGFATCLKMSEHFSKLIPTISFILLSCISLYLMSKAMLGISPQVAYSVWVGMGIIGISIVEVLFFGEPINVTKILFTLMILISIIGLKITS